jgi:hypothetical protein
MTPPFLSELTVFNERSFRDLRFAAVTKVSNASQSHLTCIMQPFERMAPLT